MTRRKNPIIPEMVPFGERVRAARRSAGMTQDKLAQRLKTSAQDLGQVENGWRSVSIPRAYSFAEALGVAPEWLLSGLMPAARASAREAAKRGSRHGSGAAAG